MIGVSRGVDATNTNTEQRRARSFCSRRAHRLTPHRLTMTSGQQFQICCPTESLNRYSRPHVRPLLITFACGWRSGFSNYVKQNLTHLARSRSYCIALLILESINLSAFIQRKNRWFGVHSYTSCSALDLYVRTCPPRQRLIAWLLALRVEVDAFTVAGQTHL